MLTLKLLSLLILVRTSTTTLPEECLTSGPGPPQTNRTKVMLGYLTDVTGQQGRQVRDVRVVPSPVSDLVPVLWLLRLH